MILKKLRPPALKQQAASAKLQAPDPEGIRNFSQQKNIWHPTFSMIQNNYVTFFKPRVPARWREAPVHPGQGCGIHSGPKIWHTECEARVPSGRGRAVSDRIFGMLKPSFQWRRSRGCIMELVPSGSGAQAPDQFRMILRYKPQASSYKHQAPSFPAGLNSATIKIYK